MQDNKEKWLEERKTYIGGSDWHCCMNNYTMRESSKMLLF